MKPSAPFAALLLIASVLPGLATADARDEVIAAWQQVIERGSYSMRMTSESRGRSHNSEIEVSLPSSFHMRSPESEMILVPQGTWMKVNGSWMKFPMNMAKTFEGFTAEAMEEGRRGLGAVEVVGEGEVEGCMATTYRYTTSGTFMGMKNDSTAEMSVCKDTGLPRALTSVSGKRRQDTVRIVYDFETPIDIRPPN